ncbi:hypothetical protein E2C01_064673 [Portunus trituberculatus]|uniref:Uncharacterized protein n=1 Tax=Portunus trituberculatus TaxID=210409 RepID=A0A5B7HPE7_PORTR|nr:hypothetical protein [Portunus trituberculatus]
MNGSVSVIDEGHNGSISCIANLRLLFRVNREVPDVKSLPTYTLSDPRNTDVGVGDGVGEIYVMSGAYPIPFASVVFIGSLHTCQVTTYT